MTTIQANDTRHAGKVDADDLFMRLSVPELNVYERRTRADIESKKQELRTMVGERYRDLIGAADSIVRMKETAFAVQDNIAKMRSSCDIHALKRNVAAKTKKKAQSSSMDEMKKLLYTSAAQIKLLADVPEQIWRNIESNNYLTAGRLFLISKAIYQNLKTNAEDGGDNSVDVMETFPVVGRQWDAVSHFKAQILQKSTTHLKSQKETDLSVIETLCAIMLLDNVTAKDMFRLLLTQRQTALRETLQPKGVESIGAQITQAIEILKATLYHINAVFLAPEGGQISALDRYLKSLQQTFSSPLSMTMEPLSHEQDMSTLHVKAKRNSYHPSLAPSTSTAGSTSNVPPSPHTLSTLSVPVLTKLYPNTPNIHLLARYLPESIQNLTPSLQLEGDRAAFRKQDILQGVQLWMEDVKSMLSTGFENLLQQVKTNLTLTSIRESVWDALRADEYSLIVKSKPSQWKKICERLLREPLSVWDKILRTGFTRAFQDIVVFSLEELSHEPERQLRPRLAELDRKEDPNHDVGRFIWNEMVMSSSVLAGSKGGISTVAALPTATEPLIRKMHEYVGGKTDLVAQVTHSFEQRLTAIRADQERALVFEQKSVFGNTPQQDDGEEDDGNTSQKESLDLFGAKADMKAFTEYYQRHCTECIKAYTQSLVILVKEAVQKPERARNTVPAMNRAMTVGRVASGIASLGSSGFLFERVLMPPRSREREGVYGAYGTNFSQMRAAKATVDQMVQELVSGLHQVYLESHAPWTEHLGWLLKRNLKHHYLAESSWTDLVTLAWEPIPSATGPSTSAPSSRGSTISTVGAEESKELLPFHVSTRLMTALHQVVQEMHRAGTGLLRPDLVQQLCIQLASALFDTLDKFLDQAVDPSSAGTGSAATTATEDVEIPTVLTEKGALQLLLDIKFLRHVFQSRLDKDVELAKLVKKVVDRTKAKIDPIDLAAFDKPLEVNAERQYARVSVLLGLLVQLNPTESNKRKANMVEKSPHVFAMAPLTARFTLLPIGQKMIGRT